MSKFIEPAQRHNMDGGCAAVTKAILIVAEERFHDRSKAPKEQFVVRLSDN